MGKSKPKRGQKEVLKKAVVYASEMALNGKGSLFVLSRRDISDKYDLLYGKFIRPFDFLDKASGPIIRALSELDGAIIIRNGKVVDVGARIKTRKSLRGHGTRHAAAFSISSLPGVVAVLSSEEDRMVRIFREGRLYVEMDPRTGSRVGLLDKIADIVTSSDFSLLASSGIASVALGVNPLAALFVFAGSYVITSKGMATLRDFVRNGIKTFRDKKR